MAAALSWLAAALVISSAWARFGDVSHWQGRELLGTEVRLPVDALSELGVPRGAHLLAQFESRCPNPGPIDVETKIALSCSNVANMRSCLGIGPETPTFVGRGCIGQRCVMNFAHDPGTCLLTNVGVNVNPNDPMLNSTCGIYQEDSHWLDPTPNPGFSNMGKKCFSPEDPTKVGTHLWVDCENGQLGTIHKLLNFSSSTVPMPAVDSYTCKYSPRCSSPQARPIWRLVCYLEEQGQVFAGEHISDALHGQAAGVENGGSPPGHFMHLLRSFWSIPFGGFVFVFVFVFNG